MENWKPRINDDKADTLLYLFGLIRENDWLNSPGIEPITRYEIISLMEQLEKSRQLHMAHRQLKERWEDAI